MIDQYYSRFIIVKKALYISKSNNFKSIKFYFFLKLVEVLLQVANKIKLRKMVWIIYKFEIKILRVF
ncbi:hypothetical protein EGI22_08055 [Lacihabitans sp. LS3-19]|nr:hypothetical protein [Lacihabitans sp. LS3-19]